MADQKEELKLIRMHEVEATGISWLWYPYIPFRKITVVQGDPGDGKTTMVLAIAAAITTGAALPESFIAFFLLALNKFHADGFMQQVCSPQDKNPGFDQSIQITHSSQPLF